ncbi:hypothetical protein [Actinoplanes derwentensis]|uniref:Lipocalin-like domain-containing protein n=1 Tax=Actinoplanes derwentensis TaxID=113562 RepID=A0A1H1V9I4_9ACTN|nr:hypothetical protein [Actinoplanes derwentensis]GID83772.1 hypothetical protein Ade03nite_26960 [Actinoplanes derwentensis]SDS81408.1 hypothetical protein SAMN04489716_1685 [Actinoplanes derwentensis]
MIDAETLRATLPGQWRVLASTFPMWLSGRRINPTFSYGVLPGPDLRFSDEVGYRTRSGRQRRITGVDRFDPATGRFTWRGRGALGLLTSRWRVDHLSDDRELIVLTFDRSLVTPAGTDVIGRGPDPRPGARDRLPALSTDGLQWLP